MYLIQFQVYCYCLESANKEETTRCEFTPIHSQSIKGMNRNNGGELCGDDDNAEGDKVLKVT